MIEKLALKFHNFMVKYVGLNWRTTASGIIALVAGFILTSPEALNFLPDALEAWLAFAAKFVVLLAGGSFAVFAKDKSVTGGVEGATKEARKRVGME